MLSKNHGKGLLTFFSIENLSLNRVLVLFYKKPYSFSEAVYGTTNTRVKRIDEFYGIDFWQFDLNTWCSMKNSASN